jgi:hypothetical protein
MCHGGYKKNDARYQKIVILFRFHDLFSLIPGSVASMGKLSHHINNTPAGKFTLRHVIERG